jgi:hypothetical protein
MHAEQAPPPLPDTVDPAVRGVVLLRAMAKDPATVGRPHRPATRPRRDLTTGPRDRPGSRDGPGTDSAAPAVAWAGCGPGARHWSRPGRRGAGRRGVPIALPGASGDARARRTVLWHQPSGPGWARLTRRGPVPSSGRAALVAGGGAAATRPGARTAGPAPIRPAARRRGVPTTGGPGRTPPAVVVPDLRGRRGRAVDELQSRTRAGKPVRCRRAVRRSRRIRRAGGGAQEHLGP